MLTSAANEFDTEGGILMLTSAATKLMLTSAANELMLTSAANEFDTEGRN